MLKLKKTFYFLLALSLILSIDSREAKRSDSDENYDYDYIQENEHDDGDHLHDQNELELEASSNYSASTAQVPTIQTESTPSMIFTQTTKNQSLRPSEIPEHIFRRLFQLLREYISSAEQVGINKYARGFDYHEYFIDFSKILLTMIKNVEELLNESNIMIKNLEESDLNELREILRNKTLGEMVRNYLENTNTTISNLERRFFDTMLTGTFVNRQVCDLNVQHLYELDRELRRNLNNFDQIIKEEIIQKTFHYKSIFFELFSNISSFLFANNEFNRLTCFNEHNLTEWEARNTNFKEYIKEFLDYYKCWTKKELTSYRPNSIQSVLNNRILWLNCKINGSNFELLNELNQNYSYYKWDVQERSSVNVGFNADYTPSNIIGAELITFSSNSLSGKFHIFNNETNCNLIVSYENIELNGSLNNESIEICRPFNFSNFYKFLKDELFKNYPESQSNLNETLINYSSRSYPRLQTRDFHTKESSIYIVEEGVLKSINVDVDITHSYIGDLKVSLVAPNGDEVILHDRTGGSNDDLQGNYPKTLISVQSLDRLIGIRIRGAWLLRVYDGSQGDSGILNTWRLNFQYSSDIQSTNVSNSTTNSVKSYEKSPLLRINDHSNYSDSIFVSDWGYLTSINIDIEIQHTATSDLELVLHAPNEIQIKLHNKLSGTNIIGNYPQSIQPAQSLSRLIGSQISGSWTLFIYDSASGDSGIFKSWQLNLGFTNDSEFANQFLNWKNATNFTLNTTNEPSTIDQSFSQNSFYSFPNKLIADFSTVDDSIYVPLEGYLRSLNVDVDITHSHIGDLYIHLISPSLSHAIVILHNRTGGSSKNIVGNYPNTLTPFNSLTVYTINPNTGRNTGMQIRGTWTLSIRDASSGDQGRLNYWKLNLVYSTNNNYSLFNETTDDLTTRYSTPRNFVSDVRTDTTINPVLPAVNISGNYLTMRRTPSLRIDSLSSINDSIHVPNEGVSISVTVDIDINHSHIGDLIINLISPNGQNVSLHQRNGGSVGYLKGNYPRTITPYGSLRELVGVQIKGNWVLIVNDVASGDSGTFNSWKLNIEYQPALSTTRTSTTSSDDEEDKEIAKDDAKLFELLKEVAKSRINLPSFNNFSWPSSVNINFYNLFYKNKLQISKKD